MNEKRVKDIAQCVGGELLQSPHADDIIRNLAFDSRRIQQRADTLFFALMVNRHAA